MSANPADDPWLTIRVHPDDDPSSPDARRVLKASSLLYGPGHPWVQITGGMSVMYRFNNQVASWPIQAWDAVGTACGVEAAS